MNRNADKAPKEPISIGKIIKEELRRQQRSVIWLSGMLNCDRRNIYDIFQRPSIDSDLLYKLSIILNRDFFAYFSANLQTSCNKSHTPTPP